MPPIRAQSWRDKAPAIAYAQASIHKLGNKYMADHQHGSMDTKGHEQTFNTFIRFVVWGAVISIGILIFLALANG